MNPNTFERLYQLDVSQNVEKKSNLSYLSWVYALAEIKKVDENAKIEVHEFPLLTKTEHGLTVVEGITVPYLKTEEGVMVRVSVTINGKTEGEWLPVMDNRNQAMKTPSVTDINKAHKRCFAKACAHHGLGLYIYAGEDLPEKLPEKVTQTQIDVLKGIADAIADKVGAPYEEVYTKFGIPNVDTVPKFEAVKKKLNEQINAIVERQKKEASQHETA